MKIALIAAELEENLSVRYLWEALLRHGHEVVLCRFNQAADVSLTAQKLTESKADIAGFSMVFTYRSREFAAVATTARGMGYKGHIIAGGHFAAFNAERLLQDCHSIDSVAVGEGEDIICKLADRNANPDKVPGLIWRNGQGNIVKNESAQPVEDLDLLAPPFRKQPFDEFLGLPIANMLSSRGCTHACDFCSIAAWHKLCGGKRHRFRSVEGVAEEIAELYFQGVRIFNFHDDNFLPANKSQRIERISSFRAALAAKKVGRIAFAIKARPDEVDEEVFTQLRDMGLFRVFLGIEAGTAESLVALGRSQTKDQNESALQIVNKLRLHSCFNLLLFNPMSTIEDFVCNVAFLAKNPYNPMNFCRTEVYAGTPLEHNMIMAGRLKGNYWGYDYAIADPQAERLFQLVFSAFHERCYGINPLHQMTMVLDYENKLLEHFYMRDNRLHNRVKGFITDANLNTCNYLEKLARIAGNANVDGIRERDTVDLRKQLDADTNLLQKRGVEILQDIREKANRCRFNIRVPWREKARTATTAGLVAAVAIGACAAEETDQKVKSDSLNLKEKLIREQLSQLSHMCEMIAKPAAKPAQSIISSYKPIGLQANMRTKASVEMKISELTREVFDTLYRSWVKDYSHPVTDSYFEATFTIKPDGSVTDISVKGLNRLANEATSTSVGGIPSDTFENLFSKKISNISFPPVDSSGLVKVRCSFDFRN